MAFTLVARYLWWLWALRKAGRNTFWGCGKGPRRTPPWSKGCWKIWWTASWICSEVSGGDRRIESAASWCRARFRRTSGSATLPDTQTAECERVPARELPERLRPADAQCLCDEQLRG